MESNADKNQDVTLAVLKNDVTYIKNQVNGISATLAILERNYIKRTEVEDLTKEAKEDREKIKASVRSVELDLAVFKTQTKTWGAAAILAMGILQFLIGTFLAK